MLSMGQISVKQNGAHLREGLARSHGLLHLCFLEHFLLLGDTGINLRQVDMMDCGDIYMMGK